MNTDQAANVIVDISPHTPLRQLSTLGASVTSTGSVAIDAIDAIDARGTKPTGQHLQRRSAFPPGIPVSTWSVVRCLRLGRPARSFDLRCLSSVAPFWRVATGC